LWQNVLPFDGARPHDIQASACASTGLPQLRQKMDQSSTDRCGRYFRCRRHEHGGDNPANEGEQNEDEQQDE
jgi:hypothetical protein